MRFNTGKKLAVLFAAGVGFAASANADSPAAPGERLTPVVRTYLDLLMCANTASEYQSDPTAAETYRETAFALSDASSEAGWEQTEFDSALVSAQERYQELELSDSDTRESWQLRHFSRERCQDRLATATSQLSRGRPFPTP
ncbi:hypothetical protein ACJO2E_03370 [Marinobacter sp. M1N3S26]|uniref:hypothetical protein n=1 Tax=Marinobacter sp. M1N3S26 TaxID=3382299 RepID=UPI00387B7B18